MNAAPWLYFVAGVLLSAAGLLECTRYIHMLQLNSYFNRRFCRWANWNHVRRFYFRPTRLIFLALFVVAAVFTAWPVFSLILDVCVLVCAAALFTVSVLDTRLYQKSAKKPLVVTARVKRLYVTGGILFLVALFFCLYFITIPVPVPAACFFLLLFLLPCPYFLVLLNGINAPVEKTLARSYVSDARRKLAAYPDLMVIGITGSYGKTSTKYILGRMLSEKYNTLVTPGNYNTLLGVVRTIREQLKPGTQVFVCEMGAKKRGDIREICDLVQPAAGIITAIGPQHLDTFGSIENVITTKFELGDAVLRRDGLLVLNAGNEYIREKASSLRGDIILYGAPDTAVYAENLRMGREGAAFDICVPAAGGVRRIGVSTKLLGAHSALNILAAAAVAVRLGLTDGEIRYAVSQLTPVTHRLEMKPFINGSLLIDDAYNANPAGSLEAARVLGSFTGSRRIMVTPGLVELGEEEYRHNYNLGLEMAKHCDEIYLVGRARAIPMKDALDTTDFDPAHIHIMSTFHDALEELKRTVVRDCVVLFENDLPDNYESA